MTKQIELREVRLRKNESYAAANPGKRVAKVEYRTESSNTELVLSPEASGELLKFLGPLLVKHATAAAQSVALDMQACIDAPAQPQIEEGR